MRMLKGTIEGNNLLMKEVSVNLQATFFFDTCAGGLVVFTAVLISSELESSELESSELELDEVAVSRILSIHTVMLC
jgi:hypothetical protein